MKNLTNYDLSNINGGAVTAALLNALARSASTLLGIGQLLGTLVRKYINKKRS